VAHDCELHVSELATHHLRKASHSEIAELVRIDDDAGTLYEEWGINFGGAALAKFAEAEHGRWFSSLIRGLGEVALDDSGEVIGFVTLGYVDDKPYLDQLSVVRASMRRGVGRALLRHAMAWGERTGELWLTTYAHLPWNAPMYARQGFVIVDEAECGEEMHEVLREQREALPDPGKRVAMVRRR
jgi:GNAT superfamily N-acetyltransferase